MKKQLSTNKLIKKINKIKKPHNLSALSSEEIIHNPPPWQKTSKTGNENQKKNIINEIRIMPLVLNSLWSKEIKKLLNISKIINKVINNFSISPTLTLNKTNNMIKTLSDYKIEAQTRTIISVKIFYPTITGPKT